MNHTEAKLDFHHPIDQSDHDTPGLRGDEETENLLEISPYCGSAEHGESLSGSPETANQSLLFSTSGVEVPAPEPVYEEILSEKVATNPTVDFETMIAADDTVGAAMAEIRNTGDVAAIDAVDSTPVKRKRGRPRKNPELKATPPVRKKEREDVCFVCFDRTNPNLVACNKRGCYKAYHPACVNRDESFFGSKAKWNCGWHICSSCQKIARYMCYTCTTSYCKDCIIDESKFVCVRGTHGFCQSCHNTVTLIEQNKLAFEKKDGIDFDDTDSFTYLFKAYWLDQKGKLSLLSEDLNNARHPYSVVDDDESSDELYDVNKDRGSSSESSLDHKSNISLKKKVRNRLPVAATDKNPPAKEVDSSGTLLLQETGWASVELLDLVAHMRNGDQSFISQFDVQALLLDYIKKYNLRDPRRKSQIICDLRLQSLFGKERVGHFEMLKLLESHFYSKEAPQIVVDITQAESLLSDNKLADDTEDGDTFARAVSDKKRKNRKRTDDIELQANIDDYAAIDVHNISHVFLRRSLVEDLLDDIETFNDKVIGSFVRIRISNAGQRQDLYRLVQIIGTQESSKPYKVGKKTTGIVLEILNLNKKETSTIDSISNQDFTEEECQRLRQSIKCGLIDRLKVGYIQEKAKVLHAVRVSDSIETEKLRLSHLRDRASETGRRKELRECVEKLQLLNNPEERRRRLDEVPQIHADPKMDPDYESPEESQDDKTQDFQLKSKESLSQRKRRELIPRGRAGTVGNNWNGMHKSPNFNRESSRRMHGEAWLDRSNVHNNMAERPNEALQNHQSEAASLTEFQAPKSLELKPHGPAPEVSLAPPEGSIPNETDKIWHYRDPSMIIQGPFSLSQLRKWNATGYFPPDLRVWKAPEKQEDSVLLADMLAQKSFNNTVMLVTHQDSGNWNENLNIKQPTFNDLPSPPPVWRTSPVAAPNSSEVRSGTYSSVWSSPIFGNPYHTPIYRETGNIWSPTRPDIGMPSSTPKVENPPSGLNGGINNYETYESECPSPTPRSESTESFLQPPVGIMATNHGPVAMPLRAHDPSLATHSTQSVIVNPESSNPVSSAGLAEFQSNISLISAAVDVTGGYKHAQKPEFSPIQKLETEFLATDRSQNPIPNFLPMEPSLPSPTPKSSFSNDAMLMMQNANAPTYGNPNANSDWGTLVTNTSWGIPVQANANNATPIYGTLSQANANNTGWGAVPQGLFVEAAKDGGRRFDYEGRSGDGYPRHRDQDTGRRSGSDHWNGRPQSGGWGGSSWPHQTLSGGGDGQRKVCRFHERGHCRKGASCKYLHIDHRRNV